MECAAGEEAQVDFGSGIPITTADGRRRRTHVFRIVLSHSRKGYSEAVYRQTTDDVPGLPGERLPLLWRRAQDAGPGQPQSRRSRRRTGSIPNSIPSCARLPTTTAVAILPTKPRTAAAQGEDRIGRGLCEEERAEGPHTSPAWKKRTHHLRHWEETVADTRMHGTTRQQVGKVFAEVERPAPAAVAAGAFPVLPRRPADA